MAVVVATRRPGSKPSLLASMPANLFGKFNTNGKPGALVDTSPNPHRKSVDRTAKTHQSALAHPKDDAVRSEPYLRLVAARPCKNCGKAKRSQAAHVPPDGKSIKLDDRLTFPLCTEGPRAQVGCHSKFDQYKLFPHAKAVKQGLKWAKETRDEIAAEGLWPKKLPKWPGDKKARAK